MIHTAIKDGAPCLADLLGRRLLLAGDWSLAPSFDLEVVPETYHRLSRKDIWTVGLPYKVMGHLMACMEEAFPVIWELEVAVRQGVIFLHFINGIIVTIHRLRELRIHLRHGSEFWISLNYCSCLIIAIVVAIHRLGGLRKHLWHGGEFFIGMNHWSCFIDGEPQIWHLEAFRE
jgi:hypothetical protein